MDASSAVGASAVDAVPAVADSALGAPVDGAFPVSPLSAATTSAVIAIGSNLGDREQTIRDAVRDIDALPGVVVTAASRLVQTPAVKPEGVDLDAPAYLNAVVAVTTQLDADDLLSSLNTIELDHGRVREIRWGDRTLDLDIIAFGDDQIHTDRLSVPHPRAWERAFVLAPWLDVDPDAVIPGRGRVADLLATLDDAPVTFDARPLWPVGAAAPAPASTPSADPQS